VQKAFACAPNWEREVQNAPGLHAAHLARVFLKGAKQEHESARISSPEVPVLSLVEPTLDHPVHDPWCHLYTVWQPKPHGPAGLAAFDARQRLA
jgi:hypothetical protein